MRSLQFWWSNPHGENHNGPYRWVEHSSSHLAGVWRARHATLNASPSFGGCYATSLEGVVLSLHQYLVGVRQGSASSSQLSTKSISTTGPSLYIQPLCQTHKVRERLVHKMNLPACHSWVFWLFLPQKSQKIQLVDFLKTELGSRCPTRRSWLVSIFLGKKWKLHKRGYQI
jgi:hypothetical protein